MATKKVLSVSGYYGWPKPNFSLILKSNKDYDRNYRAAMMYAHYELSSSDLKKEVIKYVKALDPKHALLDIIKYMHENRLAVIGKYMYILNHNGELPDNVYASVMPSLERIIYEEEKKNVGVTVTLTADKPTVDEGVAIEGKAGPTIQDRLRDRAREVLGEVEGWIDDFITDKSLPAKAVDDFVSLFKAGDLKGPHMKFVRQAFEPRAKEIELALSGSDKDYSEGYLNFKKPELKKLHLFHANLLSAALMLQDASKVTRAPKKKKPVSQEKLVSKLKYKKEDSTLGIVSLNPVQILGAKELWVYNCKTRRLAQYKSLDARGLLVKGASIENFSTDSVEKTIRKPAETIAAFKKASKVKLRTFMSELSTVDVKANGKLNDNHVILRIDK